jgi:hypothetical protein
MDNFYSNCPPKMDDGRFTTNYKSSNSYNEYIKYMNGITRDDDYRLFLQLNADKLMDSEWLYLRKKDSCWNNACVHKYPLRMDPRLFEQERKNADMLFKYKELPDNLKCIKYSDYRATETPLQNSSIIPDTCNENEYYN